MSIELFYVVVSVIVVVNILISHAMHRYLLRHNGAAVRRLLGSSTESADVIHHVLLVVAHPDDEAMFFAPLIRCLMSAPSVELHLLCLTTGNYYGLGDTRRAELCASTRLLGVHHTYILDHADIQDSNKKWDVPSTGSVIEQYVRDKDISVVVTFDEGGVSGHINHSSACHALRYLVSESESMQGVGAYALETTNMFRKYTWVLDVPYSWWSRGHLLFVNSWSDVYLAQEAMRAHASQYVWFRRLYVRVSRYMIINTLSCIHAQSRYNLSAKKNL